ncbi:TIC 22-like, chloroplastic-like protein [Drosera capensis]
MGPLRRPDLTTRFPMQQPGGGGERAMTVAEIESRLDGVMVYTMSNNKGEIVLIEDKRRRRDDDDKENGKKVKGLALMCLRGGCGGRARGDAGDGSGREVSGVEGGSGAFEAVDGVAFRLVPETLQEMGRESSFDKTFSGVPIFESPDLTLLSKDKRYLPLFFRKEDLEKSLQRARQRMTFSFPAREGDIQVAALEEIIEGMKDASRSKWDDVVFVPPGYDIPTDISQLKESGQR